jgi:maleate isomerase
MSPDRLTIGVVTPHAAAGPEVELPGMSDGRISVVLARTRSPRKAPHASWRGTPAAHAELRASTEPPALDQAAVAFTARTHGPCLTRNPR